MKNLLIYINPQKGFDRENEILVKVQIDNSLDLGWKKEDIMLATNFEFEYDGIKALATGDACYCTHSPKSTKTNVIVELFERRLIEREELYWVHDLDGWQTEVITEVEVEAELGMADMGSTDAGSRLRWAGGSVFFKESARDIFSWIKKIMYKYKTDEERALMILTGRETNIRVGTARKYYAPVGMPDVEDTDKRVKKINDTYNFTGTNIRRVYRSSMKPLRVVHFHPFRKRGWPELSDMVAFFMYSKNKLGIPIIPERLAKIFNRYDIK